jgi:hypothetical protein
MELKNKRQPAALNFNNNQLQVLLTGKFGDGNLGKYTGNLNYHYQTSCIHKEYVEYKAALLGNLITDKGISCVKNNGYKKGIIYTLNTHSSEEISKLSEESLEDSLHRMDELGLALWVYDDGSLHKTDYFYNINTQKYSREIQEDLFIPFLKNFDIYAKTTVENKRNGKQYWYLRVCKYQGAAEISKILNKYLVPCYDYKIWSSETIQKWSKLQEKLKSEGKDYLTMRPYSLGCMMRKISL